MTIPATIDGLPVTSIGDEAFYDCYNLTTVTIPDSVTSIGDEAFFGCYNITRVTIGNSVTNIGFFAFGAYSSLGLTSVFFNGNAPVVDPNAFTWYDPFGGPDTERFKKPCNNLLLNQHHWLEQHLSWSSYHDVKCTAAVRHDG